MTAPAPMVFDFSDGSFAAARESLPLTGIGRPVAVAIPAWFGMADRHQLATYLGPGGERSVELVSSCLAAVSDRYGHTTRRSKSVVLCLDVRMGWSAGLIVVESGGPTEIAAWGVAPHDVAGRLDDAVICLWLVDHLFTAASAIPGVELVNTALVIGDGGRRAGLIRDAVRQCAHPLARCSVVVARGAQTVINGTALLCRHDRAQPSAGALAHALTVRADGDPERLAMHVVAEEHASFPSATRQLFELGPDDGAPLHFDVYEQHRSAPGEGAVDHRLVVRANLVRERGYDQSVMVTFELGLDGLLSVGPVKAWRLDWQPGSLDLEASG